VRSVATGGARGVQVLGLVHEAAGDVTLELLHEGRRAGLVDSVASTVRTFGVPRAVGPDILLQGKSSEWVGTGVGANVRFASRGVSSSSGNSANLLLGASSVAQSSTLAPGVASAAVDGNAGGSFASGAVAHTDGWNGDDANPWWEVSFAPGHATVGEVRLFPRRFEVDLDEVQLVEVRTSHPAVEGTFRLGGSGWQTDAIAGRAVAMRADEVVAGESLQAKLEATGRVGHVHVRREAVLDPPFGFRWFVTFTSLPGDVPELQVKANGISGAGATVTVDTERDGTSSTVLVTNGITGEAFERAIDGQLDGATLFLLAAPLGASATHAQAQAQALQFRRVVLPSPEQEAVFVIDPPVSVGAIRVQRPDSAPLAIAEAAAFASSTPRALRNFAFGSSVKSGTVASDQDLRVAFRGVSPLGVWVLRVRDAAPAAVQNAPTPAWVHGRGCLSSWSLRLALSDGSQVNVHADVAFDISNLPVHAALYLLENPDDYFDLLDAPQDDEALANATTLLPADPSLRVLRSPCLRADCSDASGVGNALDLPDRGDGAQRGAIRVDGYHGGHRLLVRTNASFRGRDGLRAAVCVRGTCSAYQDLVWDVRDCRRPDSSSSSSSSSCLADAGPDVRRALVDN
jgi:hypothetical protein